jgi:predicted deacylase
MDAVAVQSFLEYVGAMACDTLPVIPPFLCQPTPLAGSETLNAPAPGIVVFAAQVGQQLRIGDLVAEVIDPISGAVHRVAAGVEGVLYARIRDRYITSGGELGKVAGAKPFRTGELLGA